MVLEPQQGDELIQEKSINHMRIRKLRYNSPKTTTFTKAKLGEQHNDLLSAWMDNERIKNDVFDTWDDIGEEEYVGSDDNK